MDVMLHIWLHISHPIYPHCVHLCQSCSRQHFSVLLGCDDLFCWGYSAVISLRPILSCQTFICQLVCPHLDGLWVNVHGWEWTTKCCVSPHSALKCKWLFTGQTDGVARCACFRWAENPCRFAGRWDLISGTSSEGVYGDATRLHLHGDTLKEMQGWLHPVSDEVENGHLQ